jgi:hypothetical protein
LGESSDMATKYFGGGAKRLNIYSGVSLRDSQVFAYDRRNSVSV